MSQAGYKRKLSAVFSADVAGYSRLMADDEARTVTLLATYREVMASLITQHRGRVVDSPGDNLLAEFASVVDAVQCAVAVQKEFQARNADLAETRKMEFRIGINLGDVIEEKDRIYGDGVNIAARLEALAEPGGICVSRTAFDHIESKLPLGYEFLGEQEVKNIPKPVGAYKVVMEPRVTVAHRIKMKTPPLIGRYKALLSGGVAVVVLIIAALIWNSSFRPLPEKYQNAVLASYHEGDFEEAMSLSKIYEDKHPKARIFYLIQGNILVRRGNLNEAQAVYQKGLQASKGTDVQKAETLFGLGRVASIKGHTDEALRYYQQATQIAPEGCNGYLSQAIILEDKGKYTKALTLLEKAQEHAPQDHLIASITKETRERVALASDKEKQERIDRLVDELLETMNSSSRALRTDGWTSLPLTVWLMDFQTKGYSLREGEEKLLISGIIDHLLQHRRVQVVERAVIDKLLGELKLGTSHLTDQRTALSLGRLLAARVVLPGQLVYSGPQTQVSMRIIETETGQIKEAVNETFGSSVPVSVLTEKVSKDLIEKLNKLYPLRGKISQLGDGEVSFNIGTRVGVRQGEQFRIVNEDLILEVISVQNDGSLAKIVKGRGTPQAGMRVELTETPGD